MHSLSRQKIIELLPHLQSSAPAKSSLKAVHGFHNWFTETNPLFNDNESKQLLYGNNEQNGIMQACGAASKGPSKSKKHQSKQRLIALLAELIGIVSDSPTHPDCQHGRSSAQCGSNLTQVCVNADIDILNSMRLHDMLQHNVHYQTCQYQTCQLIHTIVNLRSQVLTIRPNELLQSNSTAIEIYQSWWNEYNPIDLIDSRTQYAQRRTERTLSQLSRWSDLPTVYGFDPITGKGDGNIGAEIDLILHPYMRPREEDDQNIEKKEQDNDRSNKSIRLRTIEKAMNAVFGRTDELGRQQGKHFPELRILCKNLDHYKKKKNQEQTKQQQQQQQQQQQRTKNEASSVDSNLLELVREHFISFVKAQRYCGSILDFLQEGKEKEKEKEKKKETQDTDENENVDVDVGTPAFLQPTENALRELNKCIEKHFKPVIAHQMKACSTRYKVDRLKSLDVITSLPSTISKLLSEQDYDACIDEFECVVDFLERFHNGDGGGNTNSNTSGNSAVGSKPTVQPKTSSVSIHLFHTLDSVYQDLYRNMTDRVARTDLPLATREHLVELYSDLCSLYCGVLCSFDKEITSKQSTSYTVHSFVIK